MADGDTVSLMQSSNQSYTSSGVTAATATAAAQAYAAANSGGALGTSWENNPNYKVVLTPEGQPELTVTANIPENTRFRIQNQWEPILHLFNGIGASATSATNIVGLSTNLQSLTTKIWRSSEPLTFDFNFQFDAVNDPVTDVLTPVVNLIKMATPRAGGPGDSLLIAPGPSLFDGITGANRRISLRIGKMLYIDSVVINSLDINMPSAFDVNGNPISMDVDISVETWYTPNQDNITDYFRFGKFANGLNPLIYSPGMDSFGNVDANSLNQSLNNAAQSALNTVKSYLPDAVQSYIPQSGGP